MLYFSEATWNVIPRATMSDACFNSSSERLCLLWYPTEIYSGRNDVNVVMRWISMFEKIQYYSPSIAGNGLLGLLQLLLPRTILIEYGLTSCCENCSSGSIFTIPCVSVRVASQALRAFSRCCSASFCSMPKLDDEFGFCEMGVIVVEELFPVLVAAIAEQGRKSDVFSSWLEEFSVLKILASSPTWVGVDGGTGGFESTWVFSLELSHPWVDKPRIYRETYSVQ